MQASVDHRRVVRREEESGVRQKEMYKWPKGMWMSVLELGILRTGGLGGGMVSR